MDLNADLGEGIGDDEAMLAIVSSANLACGGHAGDPATMRRLCAIALERGVRVGAHVSYVDREGFGRRRLDVEPAKLTADVTAQLAQLDEAARRAGATIRYVKPHGALYNAVADDRSVAAAVVAAIAAHDRRLAVMGFPDSALLAVAGEHGLDTIAEAFTDRAYDRAGRLVDRAVPGSVRHDEHSVVAQAIELATHQRVTAVDGATIAVRAESLCVHGDTPGAVALARAVRDALVAHGVEIARW